MSFDASDFFCKGCNRKGCLLKRRYFAIRNIPEKYGFRGDVLYWTPRKVWRFIDIIGKRKMPLINIVQTFFGICPKSLVNPAAFELVRRWSYCKTHSTSPFFGGYDDQPREWVWICEIIEDEINKLTEWKDKSK